MAKVQKISWDQALTEISDKLLAIRKESGPDSTYWVGSSKQSNEQAYMYRKFVSFFGTNNMDHQARVCHSNHGGGCCQHLGLWRDDQLLQRHAVLESGDVYRLKRCRGASGVVGACCTPRKMAAK